jgi:predicted enzyme related to lactoylglutathione lyase
VDDLADTLRTVSATGGAIVSALAAAKRPGMQFAYASDPDGNLLVLISEPSTPAPAARTES